MVSGEHKGFFHHLVSSYRNELNQTENSHWGDKLLKHLFANQGRQTEKYTNRHTHFLPKLLCVGETGLGDRFGELVSML